MKYRIEYCNGDRCSITSDRKDLLEQLKTSPSKIADIRKLYKSGVSDSAIESYKRYVNE
jgi:hypothetical protein